MVHPSGADLQLKMMSRLYGVLSGYAPEAWLDYLGSR